MNIVKTQEGSKLTLAVEGRLDTATAPQLETVIKSSLDSVAELVLEFEKPDYLSSGLRVILTAQKIMNKQGKMIVRHANETIMEVFEVTGFSDFLTIE